MSDDRLRRWRLLLGGDADSIDVALDRADARIDGALSALYGGAAANDGGGRAGGLGASAPGVARWLGDIRTYFPTPVVRVMQQDAMKRLDLDRLLLEPEVLETVEPDVHLVGTLMALGRVIPEKTRETARTVVRTVVDELERRLAQRTRQAVSGALDRSARTRRPRLTDVDWNATVRANLRHYQPEQETLIVETLIGHGRKQRSVQRDVILCVDQSGSMATSVVYSSIFAAVLASLPALETKMVTFDTAVVDMTPMLVDPVDVLFGTQLGGGTDIAQALAYCQGLVRTPSDTVLVLISDLYEGGDARDMLARVAALVRSGVTVVALLALSDDGAPSYDHAHAAALAGLGAPAFACTPDQFPDLMAAAIERRDLTQWAAGEGITVTR